MCSAKRKRQASTPRREIIIVGNGVTGSYAALLVARLQEVTHIRLIDGDTYSESNLRSQNITPEDVGQPKVKVLARRLQRQAPEMVVEPIYGWVEQVPRSKLRGAVVLSCVDSRRARCYLNEVCWRLGVPLIDSGVDAAGLLVRTNTYRPGRSQPCLECCWDANDYAALEQVYACQQGSGGPAATNAPASLGSIAAGLLVGACEQLLAGDLDREADGQQVLWDCRHHRCLTTRYRVNPDCRFDHEQWDIEPLAVPPRSTSLGMFCELLASGAATPLAIRLAGQRFVHRLVCSNCSAQRNPAPYLDRALTSKRMRCKACGEQMVVSEFHAAEWLNVANKLPRRSARRSLASFGFRPGDILTVQQETGQRHFELLDPSSETHKAGAATVRQRQDVLPTDLLSTNVGRQAK